MPIEADIDVREYPTSDALGEVPTEESVAPLEKVGCGCDPCKRKDGKPHKVYAGVMHEYSSIPRGGWVARRTSAEVIAMRRSYGANQAPTFGVELETDEPARPAPTDPTNLPGRPMRPDADADDASLTAFQVDIDSWYMANRAHALRQEDEFYARRDLTAADAISLAAPKGLWHAKHDGSVSGPEFASQPATLAYWQAQKGHLEGMFRALLHGGMRSHDGDRCGLHVNIGTDAFTSPAHLARFMQLLADNPEWSRRMAQRTSRSMGSWANFDGIADSYSRQDHTENVFLRGYSNTGHSCAVNVSNRGRIEFRLPRGTLRVDRFYAKVEWTAAMVEYTRDEANARQSRTFMQWADPATYPALVPYMRERFGPAFYGTASRGEEED